MEEKLCQLENKYEELCARAEQPDFYADPKLAAKYMKEQRELEPVVTAFRRWKQAKADMADALAMMSEEPEMKPSAPVSSRKTSSSTLRPELTP